MKPEDIALSKGQTKPVKHPIYDVHGRLVGAWKGATEPKK